MMDKYRERFTEMDIAKAAYIADAVVRSGLMEELPDPITGPELFVALSEAQLDHAAVCMTMANDPSVPAVQCLEQLVGTKLRRPKATTKRGPAPAGTTPRQTRQRRPQSDPRTLTEVAPNPKKPGSASHARYELYKVGMTVAEFVAAGGKMADINWDEKRGFIKLEMPK